MRLHDKTIIPSFCLLVLLLIIQSAANAQVRDSSGQETLLVLEDFQGENKNRWPIINHGDTAFTTYGNGLFSLNVKNADRFWALRLTAISGTPTLRPNLLEMRLQLTADDTRRTYGMIWNTVQKAMNIFDEYRFVISKDGYYFLIQREGGEDIVLKPWTLCQYIHLNGYNILRVHQTADSVHHFYINDQFVFQKKLPPTNMSIIGFYCDPHTILDIDRVKLSFRY